MPNNEKQKFNEQISILETLEDYLFEIMKSGELSSVTYYRVTSAIKHMLVSLDIIKRFDEIKPNLTISLEDYAKILQMAQPYEVDKFNIVVKNGIDVVENMLKQYINAVMKREVHEMVEGDVDKLLAAMAKVDKMIDD